MSTLDRAKELVALLVEGGVRATADPRNAQVPCVLVTPPTMAFDTYCGRTLTWNLYALAPSPANADSWAKLDELVDAVAGILDVATCAPVAYSIAPGADLLTAYQITLSLDAI